MKRLAGLIIFILTLSSYAESQENFSLSGYVRNYSGVLLEEPNQFSILQNTFNLNFEKKTAKAAFKVNPFVYHYFDHELDLGIREAYLDIYLKNLDIRIGKQQIIWGKADGVFISDVISPKDLREFLLPEFDEIRMGITAVKLNYHQGKNTLEAVWSPVFTPTQTPQSNSIWAPKMIFPIAPTWDYSTSTIAPSLENGEVFFRYSRMSSAIDFELVAASTYYDDPVLHFKKQIDPNTMQMSGLIVRPEYHRVGLLGGSFSLPLGALVLRSEGAYTKGRYFQTSDPLHTDAAIEKEFVQYMAGIDYTLYGVKLSGQFIQERILDYEIGMINDEVENLLTFLAKKDFFREKLWVELFSYVGLNNQDVLIRPKLSYNFADGFDIQFGANLFLGEQGRFGQYNNNDMLYTKIKYSF